MKTAPIKARQGSEDTPLTKPINTAARSVIFDVGPAIIGSMSVFMAQRGVGWLKTADMDYAMPFVIKEDTGFRDAHRGGGACGTARATMHVFVYMFTHQASAVKSDGAQSRARVERKRLRVSLHELVPVGGVFTPEMDSGPLEVSNALQGVVGVLLMYGIISVHSDRAA